MRSDLGLRLLDYAFEVLQIDEQWSSREGRSLTWWPDSCAQTISAGRIRKNEVSGLHICVISVTADLVTDVEDIRAAEAAADKFNRSAGMSAMRVDRVRRTVELVSFVRVHTEIMSLGQKLLAFTAMTQIAEAARCRGQLADALGAAINHSGPAPGVLRENPDEMLECLDSLPSAGAAGTQLTESDFYVCSFPPNGAIGVDRMWVMATPQPESVTIEVPFQHAVPAVYLSSAPGNLGIGTSLIILQSVGKEVVGALAGCAPEAFENRFARYGPGLGIHVSIPIDLDEASAIETVSELNRRAVGEEHALLLGGAWHSEAPRTLGFSGYIPAVLFSDLTSQGRAGLLVSVAASIATHVLWSKEWLLSSGDHPAGPEELGSLFGFQNNDVSELIASGESHHLEFKPSARGRYQQRLKTRRLEDEIVKTVAGFMNADGGTLLVGVNDRGGIVGIAEDLADFAPNEIDGFENWLISSLLKQRLGPAALANVAVLFERVDGHDIARIEVQQSIEPVFADYGQTKLLYVRTGNSTNTLVGAAEHRYIREAFGIQDPSAATVQAEWKLAIAAALASLTGETLAVAISRFEDAIRGQSWEPSMDPELKAVSLSALALGALEAVRAGESDRDTPISSSHLSYLDEVAMGANEIGGRGGDGTKTLLTRTVPAFADGVRRYTGDPVALVRHCVYYFLLILANGAGQAGFSESDFRNLATVVPPPPHLTDSLRFGDD